MTHAKEHDSKEHEKNFALAVISIIAIVLIVFFVSSYLQYAQTTAQDSAGQAYNADGTPYVKQPSKTIIYADATGAYPYIAHQNQKE